MIDRAQLNTGLPPVIETHGYVNCVLACHKPDFWVGDDHPNGSNTYLPAWMVCNTIWYRNHADQYLGWIELEEILPPEHVR